MRFIFTREHDMLSRTQPSDNYAPKEAADA